MSDWLKKENERGPRRWTRDQASNVPPSDHLPLSLLIIFLAFEKMFIYLFAVVFQIDFSASLCWFRLILILIQLLGFDNFLFSIWILGFRKKITVGASRFLLSFFEFVVSILFYSWFFFFKIIVLFLVNLFVNKFR